MESTEQKLDRRQSTQLLDLERFIEEARRFLGPEVALEKRAFYEAYRLACQEAGANPWSLEDFLEELRLHGPAAWLEEDARAAPQVARSAPARAASASPVDMAGAPLALFVPEAA